MANRRHKVVIVCEGMQVDGWIEYEVHDSMIEPAGAFTLVRPFDATAWRLLRRDADVRVSIDGVVIMRGFVDDRRKRTKDGTMTITGRCRAGRLVHDAAPSIAYGNVNMLDAIKKVASPWFGKVTLSDARNRTVRRGKGRKAKAAPDPIKAFFAKTPRRSNAAVGQTRWSVIEEIVSRAGLIAWSSADGRELFVGQPNYDQEPQFLLQNAKPGSRLTSTVLDLEYVESNGDRFSSYASLGSGGGTEIDYGAATCSRAGIAYDNPLNTVDGTGRDFLHPKRLVTPERDVDDHADAARAAALEQAQRDFKRTTITAEMDQHGQWLTASSPTIFAPNTISRVIDEDFEPTMDELFMIYACTYKGSREGQGTTLELVPDGTEIVL